MFTVMSSSYEDYSAVGSLQVASAHNFITASSGPIEGMYTSNSLHVKPTGSVTSIHGITAQFRPSTPVL
jgi:hypothetical protein